MRGKQFHKGVEIHSWTMVLFAAYRQCPEDKLRCVRCFVCMYLPVTDRSVPCEVCAMFCIL